ncbi:ABC-2 type transport system permease protein [Pedobacter sp. AK013]|uniref:ABC transporter permease subunit n=1 Tax=Pedobacter sp. AK013 TaxID=2723071 RepID=UPI00161D8AFF|nr:ABC transporter permease subunit [Pedobacter sp. AK013]MBB6237872.1 ABC-2 type transport system permease protein [Pedobacter sp. AK013]
MHKKGLADWLMLIKKELLLNYRNKTVIISTIMIWILFIAAAICTILNYQTDHKQRQAANTLFRQQWERQQRNPHDAGHFGTYLFKPVNLLNVFDTGINDFTGSTYRVEAHVQHEISDDEAANNDTAMRFGKLTFALILQLLIPLFLLFNTSTSITNEKESGTLKMLLAQGLSSRKIIWTKVWANYLLIVAIVLPVFILIAAVVLSSTDSALLLPRLGWILITFLLYFLIISLAGIFISAICSHSGKALLIALCLWIFTGIIFPKIITGIANRSYPLMSRATFSDLVEQGYRKGLNGNDPYAARGERYINSLLKKYRVDSVAALPFNIDGLTLQFNEDYRSMAFNHYFKSVKKSFDQQQHFLTISGIFDPFLSTKRLSMALAGSDFYHHEQFFKQAQTYRNELIRRLNMQLAMHGKGIKGEYIIGPEYFSLLKDFKYQLPELNQVLNLRKVAFFSLAGWVLILVLSLQFIASRYLAYHYATA